MASATCAAVFVAGRIGRETREKIDSLSTHKLREQLKRHLHGNGFSFWSEKTLKLTKKIIFDLMLTVISGEI